VADDEVLARAFRAVNKAVGRTNAGDPVVLYRSRRICLLLPETETVARIAPATKENVNVSAREVAVSRYLSERGAPVVGPSDAMPSSPYVEEGMVVTLWPNVTHVEADYNDHEAVARAANALRQVHDVLADYPGELPSYEDRIQQCAALLRQPDGLPDLAAEDRAFLLRSYERANGALATFDIDSAPIHGDAHIGNVFFTPNGPLWTDFETACLGPRAWDVAGVPHLPTFQAIDPGLYTAMLDLRSVCVVVWCSALAADPEKRAAAEYQLARLRKNAP
jgi:Phosphotransferase enzyme family